MNIIKNEEQFNEIIKGNVVLVDFYADWCGPCKMLAPILEEVAKETEGKYVIAKVNVDENRQLAQKFQIRSIPTLIVFKDGEVSKTELGFMPKEKVLELLESA